MKTEAMTTKCGNRRYRRHAAATTRFFVLCWTMGMLFHVATGQRGEGKRRGPKGRSGKDHIMFAESVDQVTVVTAAATTSTTTITTTPVQQRQAGDYSVWDNFLWEYDEDENAPTHPIGTSRGTCVRLLSGGNDDVPGHCSFTLTIINEDEEGVYEDKLMIMGDVSSLAWETPQVLAIVGGTGEYEAAAGEVEVSFVSEFYVYDVYLD